jgi:hypothetical protein
MNTNQEQPKQSQGKDNKPNTYRVIRLIGEGSFGKAYLVECNSDKVYLKLILDCSSNKNNEY